MRRVLEGPGPWRVELEVVMGMGWRAGCSGDLGAVARHSWETAGDVQQECATRMSSEMGRQGQGEGQGSVLPQVGSLGGLGACG